MKRISRLGTTFLSGAALLSTLLAGVVVPAEAAASPLVIEPNGKPIRGSVYAPVCARTEAGGQLGSAVRMRELNRSGVRRLRARWAAVDLDRGTVRARTRQSVRFADTVADRRFLSSHRFALAPGRYELRVRLTWLRPGKDWRRTLVVGTCDVRSLGVAPPGLPPATPPPGGVEGGSETVAPRIAGERREAVAARVVGVQSVVRCGGGRLVAHAPGVVTDRDEPVYWIAQVWYWHPFNQRWEGGTGQLVSNWAYAGAVNGRIGTSGSLGMPIWWNYGNNAGVVSRNWTLPSGGFYYSVVTWLWTPSAGYHATVADHGGGSGFCFM